MAKEAKNAPPRRANAEWEEDLWNDVALDQGGNVLRKDGSDWKVVETDDVKVRRAAQKHTDWPLSPRAQERADAAYKNRPKANKDSFQWSFDKEVDGS